MTNSPQQGRRVNLHELTGQFWSGDLGLTLITLTLLILIFVTVPLADSGLLARLIFDFIMAGLIISGTLVVSQNRATKAATILFILATAAILIAGRVHPSRLLHEIGSVFATLTLLVYVRIVMLLMFRAGPITWSRIQGAVSGYLLLGMTWASAYQLVEQVDSSAFHFVTPPANLDQLTSKLTYFSFSALTTAGFGDVTPISPFARSLSTLESVVGQLFSALLIGALVAMAVQSRPKT